MDACELQYKLGETLGTGSFATVRAGTSKTDGACWYSLCSCVFARVRVKHY